MYTESMITHSSIYTAIHTVAVAVSAVALAAVCRASGLMLSFCTNSYICDVIKRMKILLHNEENQVVYQDVC